jgi:hypothetical protein
MSQQPPMLPSLDRGKHRTPGDHACVMELVSVLNGEPWSDHPRCVDPVLAAVARTVNDVVDGPARERLVALAPEMIGTAPSDRERSGGPGPALPVDEEIAARLVERCAGHALGHPPHDPSLRYALEWDLRHAQRRLMRAGHRAPPPPPRRRWTVSLRRRRERHHIEQACAQVTFAIRAAAAHSSDKELLDLLRACIADVRQVSDPSEDHAAHDHAAHDHALHDHAVPGREAHRESAQERGTSESRETGKSK